MVHSSRSTATAAGPDTTTAQWVCAVLSSATLFDFAADDYLRFAELLFLPTLALVVVYLANARINLADYLKGLDEKIHLSPTSLGITTVVAVFIVTMMIAVFVTLRVYRTDPDPGQFYFYTRAPIDGPSGVSSLDLQLYDYDGSSNLRVFLNGFKVFDTQMFCAMLHQCRKTPTTTRTFENELDDILHLEPRRPYTAHCDELEDTCPLLSDPRPLLPDAPLIVSLVPPLDKKQVNEIWAESAVDVTRAVYEVGDKPRLFQAKKKTFQDLLVPGTNELVFIQENGKFNRCYSEWKAVFLIKEGETVQQDVAIPEPGTLPGTYELCDRIILRFQVG